MATEDSTAETTEEATEAVTETEVEKTSTVEDSTEKTEEVESPENAKTEDEPKEPSDWKKLAQKWETRSKENFAEVKTLTTKVESYEKELAELRTNGSKVSTEVTELKSELSTKAVEAARFKAALAHGLSIDDTEFIVGTTEEEIAASAKKFADRVGSSTVRPTMRTQGAPSTKSKPKTLNERVLNQLDALED